MNGNATYYKEWLKCDRGEFRILNVLALTKKNEFIGNLSDLCRTLNLKPQTNTRNRLKSNIDTLVEKGFVTATQQGRTYTIKALPQSTPIEIKKGWIKFILNNDFPEEVSKETVIKCLLWIFQNKKSIVKNIEIATDLNCCEDTVTQATKVLQNRFNAINKNILREKHGDQHYCKGQNILRNAWIGKEEFFFPYIIKNT